MSKLKDLSLKELILLYDECIVEDEHIVSKEIEQRFGVRITGASQVTKRGKAVGIGIAIGILATLILNDIFGLNNFW